MATVELDLIANISYCIENNKKNDLRHYITGVVFSYVGSLSLDRRHLGVLMSNISIAIKSGSTVVHLSLFSLSSNCLLESDSGVYTLILSIRWASMEEVVLRLYDLIQSSSTSRYGEPVRKY